MENKIEVSVIVPIYNTEVKQIEKTLHSIATQTLEKEGLEIILVDDHSTAQETINFLKKIGAEYKKIKTTLISLGENTGVENARNTGVQSAKGEFICTLNPKNTLTSSYLKKSIIIL